MPYTSHSASALIHVKNVFRGALPQAPDSVREVLDTARQKLSPGQYRDFTLWLFSRVPSQFARVASRPVHEYRQLQPGPTLAPLPLVRELLWAAAVLQHHLPLLTVVYRLNAQLTRELLIGERSQTFTLLSEIERHAGHSIWTLEARLAILQQHDGLEAQKTFAQAVNAAAPRSFAAFVAHYVSERNEPNVSVGRFRAKFTALLKVWRLSE